MWNLNNAIDNRIAEVHVGIAHVELSAQHHRAFNGFRGVHLLEQPQVLLNGTISERTRTTGLRGGSLLFGNLLRCLFVNVGHSFLNEPNGKIPKLIEIVGSIVNILPVEPEPLDVVHDVLDIFSILLSGVCVVETQVTDTTKFLGYTEVHADGFGMPDVYIPVWLWREAGLYSSSIFTFGEVCLHHLLNETETLFLFVLSQILFHFHDL